MTQGSANGARMSISTVLPDGQRVQFHIDTGDRGLSRLIAAQCAPPDPPHMSTGKGRALRLVLTDRTNCQTGSRADAVLHLSRDCPVQTFPSDIELEPIRLRLPLSRVALRVALEYVAGKSVGMGRPTAHPA